MRAQRSADLSPQQARTGKLVLNFSRARELARCCGLKSALRVFALIIASLLASSSVAENKPGLMELTSSAFNEGANIPAKYTCEGKDMSPPLKWSGAPSGTKTLALIADDPDAPIGTWTHWVVFDLPPNLT